LKTDSVALVHDNTEYGTSVATVITSVFKEQGQNAPLDIAYAANATDVQSQVLQLKEKKPDVVIMITYTSDAILFAKTMQALDYKPPMLLADDAGYSDPSFIKAAGKLSVGAFNRSSWSVGPPGSPTALIAEMYKRKSGDEMDDTAARQMQGFFVLCEAIDRAGSTDPAKIQAALRATDLKPDQLMMGYKGIKFDDKGQNILAAGVIIQLQDGENYIAVWPKTNAAKAPVIGAPPMSILILSRSPSFAAASMTCFISIEVVVRMADIARMAPNSYLRLNGPEIHINERQVPLEGNLEVMVAGNICRASLSTAATASPRAAPGLRLKEMVTAGNWPEWLMVKGPRFRVREATASRGTNWPLLERI